ncbi:MAG: hypothetical protein K2Y21_12800 [Phycisphaerales bacterium]|nr:hypothetical protein [Phycisphaerales bacterium]
MSDIIVAQAYEHLRAKRYDQALALVRRGLEKDTNNLKLLDAYTQIAMHAGKSDIAIYALEQAGKAMPWNARIHMLKGEIELRRDKFAAAEKHFRKAFEIDPVNPNHGRSVCIAMYRDDRVDEAMAFARHLFATRPVDDETLSLYASFCDLAGDLDEMIRVLKEQLRRSPNDLTSLQALLTPLARVHGMDPREVFQQHLKLARVLTSMIESKREPHTNTPDPERLLRIGYCSQDFRNRSAGHFIEPIITHHDKSRFHITLYHNVLGEDELTDRLKQHAQLYRNVWGIDDKKMVDMIKKDGIDILVDLSGHTGCGRIVPFVVKPAPVQYTYMGYPNTTGLPQIDFRVVDWFTDPAGSEHLATETLVRMDGCFLCYTPPHHAGAVRPAPQTANGFVTFGSFNTLTKVSNHVLEVWAKVLHAVPNSRLLLKALALSSPNTKDRIWSTLASFGIAKERVDLFAETKGKAEHLDMYAKVDIALDPWPYNGTTTTVEAMYMGVPVVTIAGNNHVSRVGVSLLNNLGTPELIARDENDYVEIASRLAADGPKRLALRENLRGMVERSVLCDHAGFTRRLEAHYRKAWGEWCEKKQADPSL